MQTPITQHVANAAVLAATPASQWVDLPKDVTVAVGIMAFLYYLLFFVKEYAAWREKRAAKHQKVENPDVPPSPN